MNDTNLKRIVEALLFSSSTPLTLDSLSLAFEEQEKPTHSMLQSVLNELIRDYDGRGIELKQTATGYLFLTRHVFSPWIARLLAEKPTQYSKALLEVLAIIAYQQPVTRADIEAIRGVAVSSSMLKTLLEREWIHIAGHRDVPGKPAVYTTTKAFLDYFNLASLKELPPLELSKHNEQ